MDREAWWPKYNPWGSKQLDMTEGLIEFSKHIQHYFISLFILLYISNNSKTRTDLPTPL